MQKRNAPIIAATLVLAGCAVPTLDDGGARNEVGSVPEAVIALAAPGQDLTTARLRRKRAQGIARKYARPGVSVVDEFLAEKRVEAEREIARIGPDADKAGGVS